MTSSCECGNEPSDSVKRGILLTPKEVSASEKDSVFLYLRDLAVPVKVSVFWDMKQCRLVCRYHLFVELGASIFRVLQDTSKAPPKLCNLYVTLHYIICQKFGIF